VEHQRGLRAGPWCVTKRANLLAAEILTHESPMSHTHQMDDLLELFCTCEGSFECEWHERLRQGADRGELHLKMDEILEVSHSIDREAIEPPTGWVKFRGRRCEYWRRARG